MTISFGTGSAPGRVPVPGAQTVRRAQTAPR